MTDFDEMLPLLKAWIYVILGSAIVMGACSCIYPLIPTDPIWTVHRYLVMRTAAVAFAVVALPGVAIAVDLITPGGSFLAAVPEAKYGPPLVVASLFIAVALLICYV